MRSGLMLGWLAIVAGCDERITDDPKPGDADVVVVGMPISASTTDPSVCGDGLQSGFEQCENGDSMPCSDMQLGFGTVACDPNCRFDWSGCSVTDLCTAWGYYNDGYCDVCELLGGAHDDDCDGCAADGWCAEWIDDLTFVATCRHQGAPDPDCGVCGDGLIGQREVEWCDGSGPDDVSCSDFRFASGQLGCTEDCTYDMSGCTL